MAAREKHQPVVEIVCTQNIITGKMMGALQKNDQNILTDREQHWEIKASRLAQGCYNKSRWIEWAASKGVLLIGSAKRPGM